jgi:ferrous iron transport protein A
MITSIAHLKPGDVGRITGYRQGQSTYRRKLLAMGLTKGVEFKVERIAPLGDPVQIKLRNFSLTLRRKEADLIQVERVTDA